MKYIFVLVFLLSSAFGSVLSSTIVSVDNDDEVATIKIDKIDVGMSGFVVREFDNEHASIINAAVVESFDKESGIATLKLSEYKDLESPALPRGEWKAKVGDKVILAFGYTRALLIAPNSDIYNKITKNTQSIQWLHPDIFVSLLSSNGHPTPIKEDFEQISSTANIGLVFIFLDKKLYTVDARSFNVLNISDISLEQKSVKLPFYSRIDEIDANWFGEGSDELQEYEPHYFELLIEHNPKMQELKSAYEKFEQSKE